MSKNLVNWAYLSVTANGIALCSQIKQHFDGDILTITKRENRETDKAFDSFGEMVKFAFENYDCLVFVMAAGIVVRAIAGLIEDKTKDPAVLVLDEKAKYCISLLSGHIGGANELAEQVGCAIGAQPVITTASDVSGKTAVDTLAVQMNCAVADMTAAKDITAMIVNGDDVMVSAKKQLELPNCLTQDTLENADKYDGVICISERRDVNINAPFVQLVPRSITAGVGCRKGIESAEIISLIDNEFKSLGLNIGALSKIVSVDIKESEEGLIEAAKMLKVPFETISREELQKAEHLFSGSDFVKETIGVSCVAQPSAYISSNGGEVLVDIRRKDGMTLSLRRTTNAEPRGKVFVVSTGPGTSKYMTQDALSALNKCEVVAGYTSYISNIKDLINGKQIIKNGMHKETERCRAAVDIAKTGKNVALVSGGDAGVYGMAGLVLEIVQSEGLDDIVDVEIVPGVTSATASASLLGAPLMHDFVLISLSNWLTDIKTIERRLRCAGQGDFVAAIYNPKSNHRPDIIDKAQQILLEYKDADTPVGIVRNAYRPGQEIELTTLGRMCDSEINMRTTVIIGNSATYIKNGKIITPRGYKL